jgi:hypothetical protein
MVEWGVAHPTASTDALIDLISELRQVTEFPVLMAVDGVNLMYEKTKYPMEGRLLMPEELSVPAAFQALGADGFRCVAQRELSRACPVYSRHWHFAGTNLP